jgi:hypothetical protein
MDIDIKRETDFVLEVVRKGLDHPYKVYNAFNGDIITHGPSFEDLGDYLPIFYSFEKQELANQELDKTLAHLNKNDYIHRQEKPGLLGHFSRCYDQSDMLWGLQIARRAGKSVPELETVVDAWVKNFWEGRGYAFLLRTIPFVRQNIPLAMAPRIRMLSGEDHGMFIEILANQAELSGEARFLEIAYEIAQKFFKTKTFQQRCYFPFFESDSFLVNQTVMKLKPFRKRNNEFQLLKQNSNTMFGMIKLCDMLKSEKRGQKLKKTVQETLARWMVDYWDARLGLFLTNYNHSSGESGADITVFHFIDILIEASLVFDEKRYMDQAEQIAGSFLRCQNMTTGLVPFLHPDHTQELKCFNIQKNCSWLDGTVDFGISLFKLWHYTRNPSYKKAFEAILHGIITHHKQPFGYACGVSIVDGSLVNPQYSIKMTALILKIILAYQKGEEIKDPNSIVTYALMDR